MITGFVVDIEADGPIPGKYSMIEIGAVRLKHDLSTAPTFHTTLAPLPGADSVDSALAVTGYSHEDTLKFTLTKVGMVAFKNWIGMQTVSGSRPVFFSDNNGFDYMFTHWYFIHFFGEDPFGHTSRNIADIYRGLKKKFNANFKKLRKTKHTHNPVDDAMGNAEALLSFIESEGMKINLEGF